MQEPSSDSASSSLASGFLRSRDRYPQATALVTRSGRQTYAELADSAGQIAAAFEGAGRSQPALGAVLGARSLTAYQGVLATLLSGAGYVPLNPKFPAARTLQMLNAGGAGTLVVDAKSRASLAELLPHVEQTLVVVIPECDDLDDLRTAYSRHRFIDGRELRRFDPVREAPRVDPDAIAYLLFTSGSTGVPKGVMVSHRNVRHYLECMGRRYGLSTTDRCSQTFDLTFDLSVHDMFLTWEAGAELHVLSQNDLMAPAKFIRDHGLTTWFSVPSMAAIMKKLGQLKPASFPSLRWSLFCGEALTHATAADWQAAAPNSTVENLYGPTEATIACTAYRRPAEGSGDSEEGVVPIGKPLPGLAAAVVDDDLREVDVGELCIQGPQTALGYWRDREKTDERFVAVPGYSGGENRWYRTGDVVERGSDGNLRFRGRKDEQVKIRGYRVELLEIEQVLKGAGQTDLVAVVAWPRTEAGAAGTVAFVVGSTADEDELLRRAKEQLADYMVPQRVIALSELPRNSNGKIDKKQLLRLLESEHA